MVSMTAFVRRFSIFIIIAWGYSNVNSDNEPSDCSSSKCCIAGSCHFTFPFKIDAAGGLFLFAVGNVFVLVRYRFLFCPHASLDVGG